MLLPAYINVNMNGIPAIRSLSVNVTSTEVQFDFNNHVNIGRPFRGLIIVNLAQAIPTGTTGTLPIVFTSGSSNPQALVGYDAVPVTAADYKGTGVYLVWYESQTSTLQLIDSI